MSFCSWLCCSQFNIAYLWTIMIYIKNWFYAFYKRNSCIYTHTIEVINASKVTNFAKYINSYEQMREWKEKFVTYGHRQEKQEMYTHVPKLLKERKGKLIRFLPYETRNRPSNWGWRRMMSGTEGRRVGLSIT